MRTVAAVLAVALYGCGGGGGGFATAGAPAAPEAQPRTGFGAAPAAEEAPVEVNEKPKFLLDVATLGRDTGVVEAKTSGPAVGSGWVTCTVDAVAADRGWLSASFDASGPFKPFVGDWATIYEEWPPDNVNPMLERKQAQAVGYGRVSEVSGNTVKILVDREHSEAQLYRGQTVVIRWF